MFCHVCGVVINEGDKFCLECGSPTLEVGTGGKPSGVQSLESSSESAIGTATQNQQAPSAYPARLNLAPPTVEAIPKTPTIMQPFESSYASPVSIAAPTEKKRKRFLVPIIIFAAILVLLVAAIAFVLIAKPFSTPPQEIPTQEEPSTVADVTEPSTGGKAATDDLVASAPEQAYDDYILPGSDSHYISALDVEILSEKGLWLARNEILARHGWVSPDEETRTYFESKDWYEGLYAPGDSSAFPDALNDFEMKNYEMILAQEMTIGSSYL